MTLVLLMEEILHHPGWLKPYKQWDNYHPWWCRILSINSSSPNCLFIYVVKVDGHCHSHNEGAYMRFEKHRDVPLHGALIKISLAERAHWLNAEGQ